MNRSMTLLLLTFGVAISFVAWRVHAMHAQQVDHFAVLHDPSISYTGGCEFAVGSADRLLHERNISPHSKLILLVLGDRATANEPRELGKYDIPVTRKVIEGHSATERRQEALLGEVSKACRAVRPTSISPIFMGMKQAIADLRSEGCTVGSHCQLRVDSDLEENVEAGIKDGIEHSRGRKPLPTALDNTGIDVTFCGYARPPAGFLIRPAGKSEPPPAATQRAKIVSSGYGARCLRSRTG